MTKKPKKKTKNKKVPGQYLRNKTHAEIIFSSFTLQQKTKECFFPLWGSQAHPLLIMRLYKDSIKALNLLLNIERHMIPAVAVVNHTPACTMLKCSSARNSADVTLAWYVTWPTTSGLYPRLICSIVTKARLSEFKPWQHEVSNYDTTDLSA